ncbi:UNVERIFIED_CONTAM: enterobactin synthase subunit E [Mumia flava]
MTPRPSRRSPFAPCTPYPPDVAARYRAAGHWRDDTLGDLLSETARRHPGATALVGPSARSRHTRVRLTYQALVDRVERAAAVLASQGLAPGDRVVVQLPNVAELAVVVMALFRLGALPVFALPAHRESELVAFCRITDAAAHVVAGQGWGHDYLATAARVADTLRAEHRDPPVVIDVERCDLEAADPVPLRRSTPHGARASEAVAFLQLSGGTTGVPKLIPRTHADYLYSVRESVQICGVDATTVMLVALPATHNFPMSSPGMLGVWMAGGTVVLAGDPSPRTAFGLIAAEGVTTAPLVPPLVQAWLTRAERDRAALHSLRTLLVGGARLPDSVARRVGPELGAQLQQVFGMAEGLVCYTRLGDPADLVETTQGRPISEADEILVVDDLGTPVAEGDEGELLTRGPYTIRGYYGTDDRSSFTSDGWYRTGDRVRVLPSGHLRVTGRSKDQINRGGEKIAVAEVEDALLRHRAVHDAALVAVPDAYLGERTVAFVVGEPLANDLTAGSLTAHLRTIGLAGFKIPDRIEIVDRFPTTGVGKTSRAELRRALARGYTERSQ